MVNQIVRHTTFVKREVCASTPDQIFDLCHRTALQARKLREAGNTEQANGLLHDLLVCQDQNQNACPRHQACQRYFSRLKVDKTETASNFLDWDTLQRKSSGHIHVNGNDVKHGFEDLYVAQDQWDNRMWHQRLSTEIAYRYENRDAQILLEVWGSKPFPQLEDFYNDKLALRNLLSNCHIFEFVNSSTTRFLQYAPNMVAYSGRDHTNSFVQEYELKGFSKLIQKMQHDLVSKKQPLYGYVARQVRLNGSQRSASMSRLELPYFKGPEVAGSITYLMPN